MSIKKGDKLECEKVDMSELEAGYNCVFMLESGTFKIAHLSSIDHKCEGVIFLELNPINREYYSFDNLIAA